MTNIDINLIEKYFNNTCIVEEVEQVLKWFNTTDGQKFLEKSLNSDIKLIEEKYCTQNLVSEVDSDKMLKNIRNRIWPV